MVPGPAAAAAALAAANVLLMPLEVEDSDPWKLKNSSCSSKHNNALPLA